MTCGKVSVTVITPDSAVPLATVGVTVMVTGPPDGGISWLSLSVLVIPSTGALPSASSAVTVEASAAEIVATALPGVQPLAAVAGIDSTGSAAPPVPLRGSLCGVADGFELLDVVLQVATDWSVAPEPVVPHVQY